MKNVLAFFGAFNPPTVAHIDLGRYAMEQTGREGVLYVPSRSDYIEGDQGKSFAFSNMERLAMLQAVAEHNPWMKAIDRELLLDKQPRTYETLCYLREQGYQPELLMGSDKLTEFAHGWRYVEEIVSEFGIVCMCRGADDVKQMIREDAYLQTLSDGITPLQTPPEFHQISSSEVRRLLREIKLLQEQAIDEPVIERLQLSQETEQLITTVRRYLPQEVADLVFQIS